MLQTIHPCIFVSMLTFTFKDIALPLNVRGGAPCCVLNCERTRVLFPMPLLY